jgi:hypothetical protein
MLESCQVPDDMCRNSRRSVERIVVFEEQHFYGQLVDVALSVGKLASHVGDSISM